MSDQIRPTLGFYGGVGDVTGANFLLRDEDLSVMVDCGMFQGSDEDNERNYDPFPYDPKIVDVVIITHAHADHIGRLPKLIRDGFRGVIYSTAATRKLTKIMFDDSLRHVERYAREHNLAEPLFSKEDVQMTMSLWKDLEYHTPLKLSEHCSIEFFDAGHILGSAMVVFDWGGIRIGCTGDLGNSPAPLLRDTELLADLDYLLMESVYGDRNHEERELRSEKFRDALVQTIERGGTVMIPAFSLERSQEILFELNHLVEDGHIPRVPIFLDSPLAIKVTEVYRASFDYFNTETQERITAGDDVFDFPGLTMTETVDESKAINHDDDAKIIIAGSGMSTGGRILHHEKRYLEDPRNLIMFVGFQAAGTLGRKIQDGVPQVPIYGEWVSVRAETVTISGYSGHKQRDDMIEFVEHLQSSLKTVWCVMGEFEASTFLAQRLRDTVGVHAVVPEQGQEIQL